jgi:hypothetical protein
MAPIPELIVSRGVKRAVSRRKLGDPSKFRCIMGRKRDALDKLSR